MKNSKHNPNIPRKPIEKHVRTAYKASNKGESEKYMQSFLATPLERMKFMLEIIMFYKDIKYAVGWCKLYRMKSAFGIVYIRILLYGLRSYYTSVT